MRAMFVFSFSRERIGRPESSMNWSNSISRTLPTSELEDGRVLAVEYKGEPYKSNDDSREKMQVGSSVGALQRWALPVFVRRSARRPGQGCFSADRPEAGLTKKQHFPKHYGVFRNPQRGVLYRERQNLPETR